MEILIFIAKIWDSKIYDVYHTGTGTVPGNCSFFLVVSEPVSKKIGTGKKSRNRYRKNLVPEKSLGTGIGKKKSQNRYQKNLVPEILRVFPVVNRNNHWHPLIFLRGFSVISTDKHRHPLIFLSEIEAYCLIPSRLWCVSISASAAWLRIHYIGCLALK